MIDYQLRILLFLLFVTALLSWQFLLPRKPLQQWRLRWRHNLSLLLIDALCVRLFQPLILTTIALLPAFSFAPLNWLPQTAAFFAALVLLDLLVYWQHRLFHKVDWLWRLHRVHHSDPELDTTSAVRFHPIEILLSLAIKASAIWLLGIPATAVLVFDILLNSFAMFNHTNVTLPKPVDDVLRKVIVTPAMHRIHHSRSNDESNRNFGFCLSIWDQCFKSYQEDSKQGDAQLNMGMPQTHRYAPKGFLELLKMPFSLNIRGKDSSS